MLAGARGGTCSERCRVLEFRCGHAKPRLCNAPEARFQSYAVAIAALHDVYPFCHLCNSLQNGNVQQAPSRQCPRQLRGMLL